MSESTLVQRAEMSIGRLVRIDCTHKDASAAADIIRELLTENQELALTALSALGEAVELATTSRAAVAIGRAK